MENRLYDLNITILDAAKVYLKVYALSHQVDIYTGDIEVRFGCVLSQWEAPFWLRAEVKYKLDAGLITMLVYNSDISSGGRENPDWDEGLLELEIKVPIMDDLEALVNDDVNVGALSSVDRLRAFRLSEVVGKFLNLPVVILETNRLAYSAPLPKVVSNIKLQWHWDMDGIENICSTDVYSSIFKETYGVLDLLSKELNVMGKQS